MIAIIYFLFLITKSTVSISTNAFCECQEFQTSIECAQQKDCKWSTTCKDKICNDFIEESECDRAFGCAWNNNLQQCTQFTSCSNYKVKMPQSCYLKDETCIAGNKNSDGTYICQQGTIICNQIGDQKLCDSGLYQNQQEICSYSQSSCLAIDISKCSTITEKILCTSLKCSWSISNQSCLVGTCSQYLSYDMCTYVSAEKIGTKILCIWLNNSCIEANDVSALTSSNCFINTGGSYAWIYGKCIECNGIKFDTLFVLNVILAVLIAFML